MRLGQKLACDRRALLSSVTDTKGPWLERIERLVSGFLRVSLLALLLFSGGNAFAEEPYPEVWMNPGFLSYHFERDKNLREDNIGVGVEIEIRADHAAMLGTFINSDRDRTRYAGYQWRPLHWNPSSFEVSAGLIVAALDGYPRMRNGGWFVAPLPIVTIEGDRVGVNFTVVPTIRNRLNGAFAIQVKIRLW